MAVSTVAKEKDYGHPSQSHSGRYPLDQLLRRNGFAILSRPARGEPLWTRRGNVYTEREALFLASDRKGAL